MHGIYQLDKDLIGRITHFLSEEEAGNLRATSRGFRSMIATIDRTDRFEGRADETLRKYSSRSLDALSPSIGGPLTRPGLWVYQMVAAVGQFESPVDGGPRPASPSATARVGAAATRRAATRPPAWLTINPIHVPEMRFGDMLFARTRTELACGSLAAAGHALNLLGVLPWKMVFVDALASDMRKKAYNDEPMFFFQHFVQHPCALGVEATLAALNIDSCEQLPARQCSLFLSRGWYLMSDSHMVELPASARMTRLAISLGGDYIFQYNDVVDLQIRRKEQNLMMKALQRRYKHLDKEVPYKTPGKPSSMMTTLAGRMKACWARRSSTS